MSYGGNRGARGGILVRFETLDGQVRWRNLPDLEHRTLCHAGGLSEVITTFDVPRSFHGGSGAGNRLIEGLILQGPKGSPPVGKITICRESEKFAERDHVEELRALGCQVAGRTRDAWK